MVDADLTSWSQSVSSTRALWFVRPFYANTFYQKPYIIFLLNRRFLNRDSFNAKIKWSRNSMSVRGSIKSNQRLWSMEWRTAVRVRRNDCNQQPRRVVFGRVECCLRNMCAIVITSCSIIQFKRYHCDPARSEYRFTYCDVSIYWWIATNGFCICINIFF